MGVYHLPEGVEGLLIQQGVEWEVVLSHSEVKTESSITRNELNRTFPKKQFDLMGKSYPEASSLNTK